MIASRCFLRSCILTLVSSGLWALDTSGNAGMHSPASDAIHQLPGADPSAFNGSWKHFSGHLSVEGGFEVFYYFTQHADPTRPLIIWMNGGPGASSLMGLFGELGPFLLNSRSNSSNGWKLFSNPYGWHQEASLLAWEQPAGIGFSHCPSQGCDIWNDDSSALANLNFLTAFFNTFPEERKRSLYIAGESYAGIYVPLLAQRIYDHNAALPDVEFHMQLQGIAVGDGCIGFNAVGACGVDSLEVFVAFLERAAPDVDEAVLSHTRAVCGSELRKPAKSEKDFSPQCRSVLKSLFEELGPFNIYHWSSPCGPDDQGNWGDGSAFSCGSEAAQRAYFESLPVQKAMHVVAEKATKPLPWKMYDGDWPGYNITRSDVVPVYVALMKAGVEVLIYNGLRDSAVALPGAKHWTAEIGGAIEAPRRKWSDLSGLFAGHVIQYAGSNTSSGNTGRLTFATVVGAGHLVPGDRPSSARSMIAAFVKGQPMPQYSGTSCKRFWLGRSWGNFCEGAEDAPEVAV